MPGFQEEAQAEDRCPLEEKAGAVATAGAGGFREPCVLWLYLPNTEGARHQDVWTRRPVDLDAQG